MHTRCGVGPRLHIWQYACCSQRHPRPLPKPAAALHSRRAAKGGCTPPAFRMTASQHSCYHTIPRQGEIARRRPLERGYSCEMCAYVRKGASCPAGDSCQFAHNVFERCAAARWLFCLLPAALSPAWLFNAPWQPCMAVHRANIHQLQAKPPLLSCKLCRRPLQSPAAGCTPTATRRRSASTARPATGACASSRECLSDGHCCLGCCVLHELRACRR